MLVLRQASRAAVAAETLPRALAACFSTGVAAQAGSAVETLVAELRPEAGTIPSKKLRAAGKTPGVLFSLQHAASSASSSGDEGVVDSQLLALDSKAVANAVHRLGRMGWAVSLFDLQIAAPKGSGSSDPQTVRALGRQVHMRSDVDMIENVTFIACPPDRMVRVDVPLKVIGEEVCPGLKAGGRLNWIRRTIPCLARGDSIPGAFEVDISGLALNQKLHFTDLALPEGVELRVDPSQPIIKVAK